MPKLIALAGLPGTGKSLIARELCGRIDAVWLRIDTIEQAIRDAGLQVVGEAGYRVAYALAEDNLRLGLHVVADSVNPLMLTRDAWRAVAARAGAEVCEAEIVCSDTAEHRRRVETRTTDVPGLLLPDWNAVIRHRYEAWTRTRLSVDTARRGGPASAALILAAFGIADDALPAGRRPVRLAASKEKDP